MSDALAVRPAAGLTGRRLGRLPDDRLVARVRAGDDRAFEALFERHHRPLLSFCRHMLGQADEAEDAVQQTFIRALAALRRDDRPVQLKPWLYGIARNRCLTILGRRRELPGDASEVEVATEGLADEVQRRDDLRALVGDLQRLPTDQRAALLLAELGNHSHEEVAGILACPRDKVKALVFQAREALIAQRQARDTSCAAIRAALATARGADLRRAALRRHLHDCAGCRDFKSAVAEQRSALALLLPVTPSAAFGLGGASAATGAAAAGVGVGASASGSAATESLGTAALTGGAKMLAAKALVAATLVGATTPRVFVAVLGAGALLAGSASAASIVRGTAGDDTLTGTAQSDLIRALAGDDTVAGQDGNDTIFAGSGHDKIDGGTGDDRLWAKAAVDVVALGDEEGDVVTGGDGDDRIHVRDGERDEVTCGDGEDTVVADQFDSVADDCEVVHRKDVTEEELAAANKREQTGAERRHARAEQVEQRVKQKLQDRLQRRAARRA